jgi:hypothetical protein
MTYNEAYNKIIDAYFKDEIKPFHPAFCFCGTLCENKAEWYGISLFESTMGGVFSSSHHASHGYTGQHFERMESALLNRLCFVDQKSDNWEDALFKGMCAALEVLKQIHLSKGEIIDEVPEFKRRVMV